MPHRRCSRRSVLRAVLARPMLEAGVFGSPSSDATSDDPEAGDLASGDPDVAVTVHAPPSETAAANDAVAAIDRLDAALSGPDAVEIEARAAQRTFPIADYDDAAATVRGVEDALFGPADGPRRRDGASDGPDEARDGPRRRDGSGDGPRERDGPPADPSRSIHVVCYRHGLPWEVFDELGGAGFSTFHVGAEQDDSYCTDTLSDCRRRYGDEAGPYALAFVNLGILGPGARLLLETLDYDADAMFANTVIHEIAHCFGVGHEAGAVGVGAADVATPMLTWYCEHSAVANDFPGECCGEGCEHSLPGGHEPVVSECTRERIVEHVETHLR